MRFAQRGDFMYYDFRRDQGGVVECADVGLHHNCGTKLIYSKHIYETWTCKTCEQYFKTDIRDINTNGHYVSSMVNADLRKHAVVFETDQEVDEVKNLSKLDTANEGKSLWSYLRPANLNEKKSYIFRACMEAGKDS